ncbi:MAG: GGDEF domain-containing protein [Bacilli bacterium]|nr:GGDEF domain-containing protein [Bacilli bacterium]
MKKSVKRILLVIPVIVFIVIATLIIMNVLKDENKLTVKEKEWINNNLSTVQNVNIINNLSVFGANGSGVFYDFINDMSKEYGLKINPVTYNNGESSVSHGFMATNSLDDNSLVIYEDNYVLIKKDYEIITDIASLSSKSIGVLSSDVTYLNSYLKSFNLKLTAYENKKALEEAFSKDLDYILVPKYEYLDYIVANDYQISYHFNDIKRYYTYELQGDYFSSIIKKYFTKWNGKYFDSSYNKAMKQALIENLKLTDSDIKQLNSKVYSYGFINNSPYEIIMGGNYGGIISVYLNKFSKVAGVDFKYSKYRSYKLLTNAINDGSLDLYFNYYTLTNNYKEINTHMNIEYNIIAKESNSMVVNSLDSLKGKTVYVLQDSMLYNYLATIDDITINTYRNVKELKKIAKQDSIIMIDHNTYDTYANKELSGYTVRYTSNTDGTYNFKVREDGPFYKTLNAFIKLQDPNLTINEGLYNYTKTLKSGTVLGTIAKYSLYLIIGFVVVMYLLYKSTKRVKISKKIKKVEKIRYIDQLTSLKNRNYLNENINAWNKNTIYPQATIVLDLNKLQEINDTLGYEKGDRQIKAAANILIKTQLDNSDIMRTDGNEFLIYLVGYEERQIISYIKKLYKEFKNLPYEYGATIGHSMITNDLKSIEDAINESVEDMKQKKQDLNRE